MALPVLLLLAPLLLLATSTAASIAAEEEGAAARTTTMTARLMSLTYTAPVDPTLVHSHSTKMRWSSVRHKLGFDPADPSHSLAEEEDESLRPTLCRTLARRLGREVFSCLAERLDGEDGRTVMAWRGEAEAAFVAQGGAEEGEGPDVDMRDLEPRCRWTEGKGRRYGAPPTDGTGDIKVARQKMMYEQSREIEQTCSVRFGSLLPYYGIGFDLSLTLSDRPMSGLSPDEVRSRLTPDRRGWTQPVRTTEARIQLTVQSPDHGDGGVGLGNAPPHLKEEALKRRARASNAERAVDKLVLRADAVLNVIDAAGAGRTVEKTNLGSKIVALADMPTHPSMLSDGGGGGGSSASASGVGKDDEVPAHIQEICKEHGLDEAKCRRAWEIMREDMKKEEEEQRRKAEAAKGAEKDAEAEYEPEGEPEPEPEQPRRREKKVLPVQSDEEVEAEMDAWMAAEAEREAREAAEAEMAEREREEREREEEARLAAERKERELDELVRRREEMANEEVDEMLVKIEEAQRRSEEMRRRKAEEEAAGVGANDEACAKSARDDGGAPECPGDRHGKKGGGAGEVGEEETYPDLPSPSLDKSDPPHSGPPEEVARDEL